MERMQYATLGHHFLLELPLIWLVDINPHQNYFAPFERLERLRNWVWRLQGHSSGLEMRLEMCGCGVSKDFSPTPEGIPLLPRVEPLILSRGKL